MRVVHLATTYPLHAGDSNAIFVEALAEATAARGHRVDVVLPWHPRLVVERPGKRARLHPFRYSPFETWHPWGYAQALTADRSLRFDAYLAALPAAWTSFRGLRRLLAEGDVDVVHAHWLLPNGPIAAAAAGRRHPLVISCHGSGVFLAESRGWARRAGRYALRRARAVTGCSGDLVDRVRRLGGGPEARRIPYGVDVERFRPRDEEGRSSARRRIAGEHGLDPDAPWVFSVGRLVHKKGFDRLIESLPSLLDEVPEARVVLAGAGPLESELLALADAAGVGDALHLVGPVAHREIGDWYAAADVVAVPSIVGPAGNVDGLPNVLLEALACGRPVVASRLAGIPDVVDDGENGLLVPPGNVESLAASLSRTLRDPELRRRLGESARRTVTERLSWERIAARFEEVYRRAAGGRGTGEGGGR